GRSTTTSAAWAATPWMRRTCASSATWLARSSVAPRQIGEQRNAWVTVRHFPEASVRTKSRCQSGHPCISWDSCAAIAQATSSPGLRLCPAFALWSDRRFCTCTRGFGLLVLHECRETTLRSLAQLPVGQRAQRLALARRHDPCRPLSVCRLRPVRGALVQVGHEPEQRFA